MTEDQEHLYDPQDNPGEQPLLDEGVSLEQQEEAVVEEAVVEEAVVEEAVVEEAVAEEALPVSEEGAKEASDKSSDDDFISSEDFQVQFEALATPMEKIDRALDYLRQALASHTGPHLKEFWVVRKLVLPVYQSQEIEGNQRSERWAQLDQLTREARRLRELVNEQSAFAAEQIELAIADIEKGLENIEQEVSGVEFTEKSEVLRSNTDFYRPLQQKLVLLNAYASRINALRKELIKTDIRIRQKNKLFKRLSAAGDKVFPRRKELIKQLSDRFIEDVNAYVNQYFSDDNIRGPLYVLREEIKALQSAAKSLTLNTQAFVTTRKKLSECWDCIKDQERDRKQKRFAMREVYQANADKIMEQLAGIEEQYQNKQLSLAETNKRLGVIQKDMRKVELGPEQVKKLKEKIAELRQPINEQLKAEEDERKAKVAEELKKKQESEKKLQDRIQSLKDNAAQMEVAEIEAERDAILIDIRGGDFRKSEQVPFERLLVSIKDLIVDKKEEALLALSADDRQALENLNTLRDQRRESRKEVKKQLDEYKRSKAASGLDFEKAIQYSELISEEKQRLDKISEGIKDIEQKIQELRNKA
ncbi:MAG: hypothetical protein ACQEP8_02880 [Chlamydiota bacterium]